MYNRDRSFGIGTGGTLPPVVKNIVFINGIIFIMQFINQSLNYMLLDNFALNPYDVIYKFKIWQLVTYMFLHGGFWHVFFNMFVLWMFGSELEREWGSKEFLKYYFITGIGAGLTVILLSNAPTIGASGAVYGIMLAYALRYPDRSIYIWFLFPVKVKYFMAFLTLVSFFSTIGPNTDGIAHAAHLGGIVIGIIYLKFWYLFYKARDMLKETPQKDISNSNFKYTKGGGKKTEYYRRAIDELLDKINRVGYLKLTDEEKKILEEGSKYLREHDKEHFN
ncbi:MAG: rhomboid family intramembrane serine protease [Calditrichales bacterium]|nr:rhomboid family intramembrane serine protease [Calditrichales bacterium]